MPDETPMHAWARVTAEQRLATIRAKPLPKSKPWRPRRKRVPPALKAHAANILLTPTERARASILSSYRQAARARSLTFSITAAEFFVLISGSCFYCGVPPSNAKRVPQRPSFRYSGLDRLNPARGYETDNVVPCCRTCNFAKRQQSVREFVAWVERAYRHLSTTALAGPVPES
jgi:hypothetical protein